MSRREAAVRRGTAALALVTGVASLAAVLRAPSGGHPHARHLPPFVGAVHGIGGGIDGGRYLVFGSGLVLVVAVRALLRGHRAAWAATVAALGVGAVGAAAVHHGWARSPLLVVLAVLVALVRWAFPARGDSARARRGLGLLLGGLSVLFAFAAAGLYQLDGQFRGGTTLTGSLVGALRLLVMLPVDATPATRHAAWLVSATRGAALGVVLAAAWLLIAAAGAGRQRAEDRPRVQALLDQYATTALASFQLLPDKRWLLTRDGRAMVGYGVSGRTAVALGGPIGAPDARATAVADFLQLCRENGWTPAFHQVTPAELPELRAAGLRVAKIGEEALVDVAAFDLSGRAMRSVRSAVRRCERAGYRVVELPHPVSDDDLARLREVSDAWAAEGGHRERTFTLGQFDADQLRRTPVLAVVDADDRVQAFVNLLPPYRSDQRSFDLMRRRPGSVNGVMDQLFVAMIERARAEGAAGLALGLAPFTGLQDEPGVPAQVMRVLYDRGGALFHYAGLRAFKDKWQPVWEPRHLVTAANSDLPRVALAVARLGELPDRGRGWRRARGVVQRFPATCAFLVVQLWLMVSTAYDPQVHRQLFAATGSSWDTLAHGQLWRLLGSPVVQTSPGFLWLNLGLGLLGFALVEARLGSRWTAVLFFLGDLLSSIPVVLAVRLLAGTGLDAAQRELHRLDGGSSAGTWALLTLAALTLSDQRRRRAAVALVLTVLGVTLVADRQLFDVQHLVSALGVLGLAAGYRAWRRRPAAAAGPPDAAGAPVLVSPSSGAPGW